ncbi:MAG TPA: cysteine--tRNA ligase [Patescibacteria group bacterium]|nr:cysteine--tRNA ligase [Patescibacteria group bacterium]
MALKLYNTLNKKKEEFQPINPGKVSMYTCGPTVYDFVHIGNIKSYMTADILRRYLEYQGLEVRHIKNITDVGHLTEDDIAQGDTGEDKIEKKARKEKKTPQEIAQFYENYFKDVEKKMNILPARRFPRASEYISEMIKIISSLIEKGYAYETNGNVFYDVTKFADYGKLSGNTLENLKVGARLEEHPDKRHAWDFALWLKAPKEHISKWDSPWSVGYPGWHIECSAMSLELGDTLDIHTGGEDNIFPHHEAEIAQSEAHTGKKFVNYWMHTRMLKIDGEKMSKSKGNFYRLEDIVEKNYNPMVIRLLILSAHYKSQLNFTWQSLEQAKVNYSRIVDWVNKLENMKGSSSEESEGETFGLDKYQAKFEEAMDDDLNTPLALAVLYELITETNKLLVDGKLGKKEAQNILKLWERMNKIFGLTINEITTGIPDEIKSLAEERKKARKNKDFNLSDELRDKISGMGFIVEDLKDNNYTIKKK